MDRLNKIIIFLIFCFCITSCNSAFIKKGSVKGFKNVILIGWDGTRRSRLKETLREEKLPNLKQIIQEGSIINIKVTSGDTSTKTGWAEILTGYSPRITGVYNSEDKYKPIPRGYTIFERLEDYFGDKNIITVFLAGKKDHLGTRGAHQVWPKGKKRVWLYGSFEGKLLLKNKRMMHAEGEPYMKNKENIDFFENGLGKAENVGPRILHYIQRFKEERFFIFVQFEEPDELGHEYGEGSIEYSQGIIIDDNWLGKTVDLLKNLKIYNNTLIYIISDHGFDKNSKNHDYSYETFLATNDPCIKKKKGDRKDFTPTILRRYDLNIKDIKPSLDGRSLY